MTVEEFNERGMRESVLHDSRGARVGEVAASSANGLEVRLDEGVRSARLVHEKQLTVDPSRVRLVNGRPRLTMTIDELFDDAGVAQARPGTHGPGVPPQPHRVMDRTRAGGSGRARRKD